MEHPNETYRQMAGPDNCITSERVGRMTTRGLVVNVCKTRGDRAKTVSQSIVLPRRLGRLALGDRDVAKLNALRQRVEPRPALAPPQALGRQVERSADDLRGGGHGHVLMSDLKT